MEWPMVYLQRVSASLNHSLSWNNIKPHCTFIQKKNLEMKLFEIDSLVTLTSKNRTETTRISLKTFLKVQPDRMTTTQRKRWSCTSIPQSKQCTRRTFYSRIRFIGWISLGRHMSKSPPFSHVRGTRLGHSSIGQPFLSRVRHFLKRSW